MCFSRCFWIHSILNDKTCLTVWNADIFTAVILIHLIMMKFTAKKSTEVTCPAHSLPIGSLMISTVFVISSCMSERIKCKNIERVDSFTIYSNHTQIKSSSKQFWESWLCKVQITSHWRKLNYSKAILGINLVWLTKAT